MANKCYKSVTCGSFGAFCLFSFIGAADPPGMPPGAADPPGMPPGAADPPGASRCLPALQILPASPGAADCTYKDVAIFIK